MSQETAGNQSTGSVDYTLKILGSKLSAKALKHVSMDYENWLQFAESQMKASTEDFICHISQFKNRYDSLVFVLLDSVRDCFCQVSGVGGGARRVGGRLVEAAERIGLCHKYHLLSRIKVGRQHYHVIHANKIWIVRFADETTL